MELFLEAVGEDNVGGRRLESGGRGIVLRRVGKSVVTERDREHSESLLDMKEVK